MSRRLPSRLLSAASLLAAAAPFVCTAHAHAGPHLRAQPVFQQQRPHPNPANRVGTGGDHLAQWMSRHQDMPLAQQQRALGQEPGFHDLPPETQQRMRNRLTELNNMSPERRARLLARTEAMERLAPAQRQQVRSAMQQLAGLPEDRRRLIARAFRDLRSLPPQQRQDAFNTDPRYTSTFSPPERATLSNLLAIEPYLPPPHQQQQFPQSPYSAPGTPYAPPSQPFH